MRVISKDWSKVKGIEDYLKSRRRTGFCECGAEMKIHPKCEGCNILCGSRHLSMLCSYRGRSICSECIKHWQTLEKLATREVRWKEFSDSLGRFSAKIAKQMLKEVKK